MEHTHTHKTADLSNARHVVVGSHSQPTVCCVAISTIAYYYNINNAARRTAS